MNIANNWKEYEILDMANGEKLERWGEYTLIRPDPQIIWKEKSFPNKWNKVNGVYNRSKTGGGSWNYKTKLPASWQNAFRSAYCRSAPLFSPRGENANKSQHPYLHTSRIPFGCLFFFLLRWDLNNPNARLRGSLAREGLTERNLNFLSRLRKKMQTSPFRHTRGLNSNNPTYTVFGLSVRPKR